MTEQAKTRWERFRENIALTADLIQIVTAAAVVAGVLSLLIGLVNLTVALIVALVALAVSIAANIYLLRKRRNLTAYSARMKEMSDYGWKHVRDNLDREIERHKPKEPEPSEWLPDPKNLNSLALTNADLDRAWAQAEAEARDTVGPDAHVWFTQLALMPLQCAYFHGHSAAAEVEGSIFVSPPPSSIPVVTHDLKRERKAFMAADRPWRKDGSWRELVLQSWSRERHMHDGISLFPHTPSQPGESAWVVCYQRSSGHIKEEPHCYVLWDGMLVML